VIGHWLLVIGCWLLVVGCWLLVVGCWLLVIGHWLLVIGHWLLVVGGELGDGGEWGVVTPCRNGVLVFDRNGGRNGILRG